MKNISKFKKYKKPFGTRFSENQSTSSFHLLFFIFVTIMQLCKGVFLFRFYIKIYIILKSIFFLVSYMFYSQSIPEILGSKKYSFHLSLQIFPPELL